MSFSKIGCVIVLYEPQTEILNKVLFSVSDQVDSIFIADNSKFKNDLCILNKNYSIVYEKMPYNIGIAAAQNVGIKYFIKNEYTHVIFLDQDSIMDYGLVNQLMSDFQVLKKEGIQAGAIGPRPFNRNSKKKYRGSVKKGKVINEYITEVTELISSSTLVPIQNFLDVGLLDEILFIDGVDHEWCWRGKKLYKLRFFISEKAQLSHFLGEGDRFFLIRDIAIPTPFRTYYQFRNYFILLRRDYVPLYWKLTNGFKYLIKLFYYPVFIEPRYKYFSNIARGLKDGIFRKWISRTID